MQNLIFRILTAVLLLPLVLLVLFAGGYYLIFLLALVGCLCSLEISSIIHPKSSWGSKFAILTWTAAFFPAVFQQDSKITLAALLLLILIFNAYILFTESVNREDVEKFSLIFIWSFYVTIGLSTIFWLQSPNQYFSITTGIAFILLGCAVVWANDTFAYAGGRLFGRHPLFKRVSAKKTWEGFFCGAIFSIAFALALKHVPLLFGSDWLPGIDTKDVLWIALPATILAPFGDLMESRLKRFYEVKDASNILPGHGGLLDRIDSILAVLPWTALYAFLIRPLWY